MELQEIIAKVKDTVGDKVDIAKITEKVKGMDHKNMSMKEIIEKFDLGDLDGDGKKEGLLDEVKGKFSGMFGHK